MTTEVIVKTGGRKAELAQVYTDANGETISYCVTIVEPNSTRSIFIHDTAQAIVSEPRE